VLLLRQAVELRHRKFCCLTMCRVDVIVTPEIGNTSAGGVTRSEEG
jgi:D-alanine-D-alanine ligase-like ATP-grasp enzyme